MKLNTSPEKLVSKYVNGTASEEERAWIESWHLKDLSESTHLPAQEHLLLVNERMSQALSLNIGSQKRRRKISLWPYLSAAVSIVLISGIIYFQYTSSSVKKRKAQTDILPGQNKATLTLSNGKKITLNTLGSNVAIAQNDVYIHNIAGGKLVYMDSKNSAGTQEQNILETPTGGQYQLTLPDGTKVWLNSGSRLIYPTRFTGKERKVKLSGEAYFEVAKNKKQPFKISSADQTIEVLGTHFNIHAYQDEEKTTTTLLEGKIRIYNSSSHQKILSPGQEAISSPENGLIEIRTADIEKNIAWKNNEFVFNGEDLKSIMKSVARWYNVEVIYKSNTDQTRYWGTISRTRPISAVLKMLQSTGKVSFRVEGRRIIIMD